MVKEIMILIYLLNKLHDTVELHSGDKASGGLHQLDSDAATLSWRILDLCNNEVDGSYNVIVAGKFVKYNITKTMYGLLVLMLKFATKGFGVTTHSRPKRILVFLLVGTGVAAEGLEGGTGSDAVNMFLILIMVYCWYEV